MTEPRMRMRHKGQQFDSRDLEAYLVAFGDSRAPLPETIRVLDEIITDFIIETCHEAALCASYSRRAKIKVDDFKFILRKDPVKLGRVTELLGKERELRESRKVFEVEDAGVGKEEGKEGKKRKKEGEGEREGKKVRKDK
ncbi:TFIID-18kDa-domain-containing protein [Saccharata proteae CBS 121410]|uniref:Transcription initiation factor TFIID subunit 13 n=1 Tax=Saccharata proteae CBS 121410 TaxID=1314787 RepID=A0A9P4HQD2_9PEZI|nr:TFIID-18kDa-domain-containing protein [Saccharata proteae CBS 121410]